MIYLYFIPLILCLVFIAYFYVEDSKLSSKPKSDTLVPVLILASAVPGVNIILLILLLLVAFGPM